jgi:predicted ATPase
VNDWRLLHEALTAGQARALLERLRPEEALALLEPLVADRPNDEPLHRVLMEALDQAGRRWDALDVYERLCRVLDEEYAAAPEAATLSLYRRILSGQISAGPAVVSNLPAAVTSFVGRRREIAELLALAGRTRLLTLSGPGGAGKTRLAIEVARRLANAGAVPDGVWLVDLSGVRDGRLIPAAAAASPGLALTGARPTTAAVVEQLADRRMVVLLDNCEHLLGACAEFAMALVERCADVAVLATSREPLRLPGEAVWRVPSLELPDLRLPADPARLARLDSVQLFLEPRGTHHQSSGSTLRLPCRSHASVCAWTACRWRSSWPPPGSRIWRPRSWPPGWMMRWPRWPDGSMACRTGRLLWRRRWIGAMTCWRMMSVRCFAGCRYSLEGSPLTRLSRCVRAGSEPVAAVVSRLVDKSLVTVETSGDRARFRLLEVIRQYAAGCLASSGELACHQRRHALWYAGRAESEDPDLGGGVVGEPSPWFAVEGGNLRAALSTSLREMPDRALVMAVAMWRSWMARGLHAEALRLLVQALEACPAPSALRARALFATAVLEVRLGRPWRGPAIGVEIAALGRDLGDPGSMAEALHQQSLLALMAGEWDDAAQFASEAGTVARGMTGVQASKRAPAGCADAIPR